MFVFDKKGVVLTQEYTLVPRLKIWLSAGIPAHEVVTAQLEALIQIKPMCRMAMWTRIEGYARVSFFFCPTYNIVQQDAGTAMATIVFQRGQVINIYLLPIVQFLQVTESDGCGCQVAQNEGTV